MLKFSYFLIFVHLSVFFYKFFIFEYINIKKNREKEYIENLYEFLTKDEKQKQKYKDYHKQYKENKTDEKKQKMKDYQKEYRKNMTDERKQRYRKNITNKQKQKQYIKQKPMNKNKK